MRRFSIGDVIIIIIASLSILFDITIIALFARQKLGPITFVVFQSITTFWWAVWFLLSLVTVAASRGGELDLAFFAVLFFSSLGQLIYGSILLNRKRKGYYELRGNYSDVNADNTGSYGFQSAPAGSYAAYNPHRNAPPSAFRGTQPELSAQPSVAVQHPAFRESGDADDYYNPVQKVS